MADACAPAAESVGDRSHRGDLGTWQTWRLCGGSIWGDSDSVSSVDRPGAPELCADAFFIAGATYR